MIGYPRTWRMHGFVRRYLDLATCNWRCCWKVHRVIILALPARLRLLENKRITTLLQMTSCWHWTAQCIFSDSTRNKNLILEQHTKFRSTDALREPKVWMLLVSSSFTIKSFRIDNILYGIISFGSTSDSRTFILIWMYSTKCHVVRFMETAIRDNGCKCYVGLEHHFWNAKYLYCFQLWLVMVFLWTWWLRISFCWP